MLMFFVTNNIHTVMSAAARAQFLDGMIGGGSPAELVRINKLAKKFKLHGKVIHSDIKRKRFAYIPTESEIDKYDVPKIIRFGDPTATTYFDDHSLVNKRSGFRARHSEIYLKDGRKAYKVKITPAFLAYNLLW